VGERGQHREFGRPVSGESDGVRRAGRSSVRDSARLPRAWYQRA
jgi:hypothetical protein